MPKRTARVLWAAHVRSGGTARKQPDPSPPGRREAFQGTILGIDPSLRGTGLSVILCEGSAIRLLSTETHKPGREAGLPECLGGIAKAVRRLLKEHQPDTVAVEETIYVQNFRTAQKLGAARGAAIGQAALAGLPVFEYPPLRIKQAVVGFGRASKEQVTRQVSSLLQLEEILPFDEADATAVAICHALTHGRG